MFGASTFVAVAVDILRPLILFDRTHSIIHYLLTCLPFCLRDFDLLSRGELFARGVMVIRDHVSQSTLRGKVDVRHLMNLSPDISYLLVYNVC